jgi:hypothetical protein
MTLLVSATQPTRNIFLENVPRGGTSARPGKRLQQVCKQENEVTTALSAGITVNEFVEWISKQTRLLRHNNVFNNRSWDFQASATMLKLHLQRQ